LKIKDSSQQDVQNWLVTVDEETEIRMMRLSSGIKVLSTSYTSDDARRLLF